MCSLALVFSWAKCKSFAPILPKIQGLSYRTTVAAIRARRYKNGVSASFLEASSGGLLKSVKIWKSTLLTKIAEKRVKIPKKFRKKFRKISCNFHEKSCKFLRKLALFCERDGNPDSSLLMWMTKYRQLVCAWAREKLFLRNLSRLILSLGRTVS